MGKIIVYGLPYSNPTRAVLITAKLLELEVDFRTINILEKNQYDPEFLKINPQHTIPTINDNGNIFWDSHSICTYLIDKYGKDDSLYPKDLYTRARVNQRLYFEAGVLFSSRRNFLGILLGKEELSNENRCHLIEAFDLLEGFFNPGQTFLIGDTLTVCDISCFVTVTQLELIFPIDDAKYPNIRAWLKRIEELPYFHELNTKTLEDIKNRLPEMKEQLA